MVSTLLLSLHSCRPPSGRPAPDSLCSAHSSAVDSHGQQPTPLSAFPLTPMDSTPLLSAIPSTPMKSALLCSLHSRPHIDECRPLFLLLPSLASSPTSSKDSYPARTSTILSRPLSSRPFILPMPTNPSQLHSLLPHHTTRCTPSRSDQFIWVAANLRIGRAVPTRILDSPLGHPPHSLRKTEV